MAKNKNKQKPDEMETEVINTDEPTREVQPTPEPIKNALAEHQAKEEAAKADPSAEAHMHLAALYKFVKGKKEEKLANEHGIHRTHTGLILEFMENINKQKFYGFSDGHREMLKLHYDHLVHQGKIK